MSEETAPNFDDLLESTWDEAELPEVPEGYWKAELLRIHLEEEDRETKKGDPFRICKLWFKPLEPEASVDPDEAREFLEKASNEDAVPMNCFLFRRKDFNALRRRLKAAGVPEAGNIRETAESYDGGCVARIQVEVKNPEFGAEVTFVAPVQD